MKASKIFALLAMAVLFATSAFAAANKASVVISTDTVVGDKTLSAGDYTVRWEGQGQNLELSVVKGKQLVVKTPARLLDLSSASPTDSIETKKNADGTRTLTKIEFGGKKYALEIGGGTGQTDVASRVK
jgi:hypothetical protein